MTRTSVARNYLVLRATRWLPTGLLIPILVLLLVDRGLSLGQIGIAIAAQGLAVFLLELPTGGLADALGRRPVLLVATLVEAVSLAVLLVADSVALVAVVFVLQGIYRALESGPLDSWFVDTARRRDPAADIGRVLAYAGTATSLAIAAGALVSAGLVALDPVGGTSPFTIPIVVAIVLRGVDLVAVTLLMTEDRNRPDLRMVAVSIGTVPSIIATTLAMIRSSVPLAGLIAVEFFWGFGMTSFETLTPAKLAETTGSTAAAASLFGPIVIVAWVASAAGAAGQPLLSRRIGPARAAMALHLMQALLVVGLAVSATTAVVAVFYVLTMTSHGAANPAYQNLLHQQADEAHRATVVSAASMAGHPGAALGGIALGSIADRTSVSTAMVAGAAVLAMTIPLYIPVEASTTNRSALRSGE